MTSERFDDIIERQMQICKAVLCNKAEEYATNDRLHNFKNAAGMMSCNPKEALAGMMAKHTISIYDMCRDGKKHGMDIWQEKITDHINYLLLLKALVAEEIAEDDLRNLATDPVVADFMTMDLNDIPIPEDLHNSVMYSMDKEVEIL